MTKSDSDVRGLTIWRIKPRHVTRRRIDGPQPLGGKLHLTCRCAKADAGEGVDDDAQAGAAAQAVMPGARFVAVHFVQKATPIRASQNGLNFSRE